MGDFTGTGGNDVLVGTDGNDNLYGLGGADFLKGLFGDDYIDGGPGNDRATYYLTNPALGGVTVSLMLQGQPQYVGSQGWDTLVNIEDLSGTPLADVLTGDNNDNWLWGSPATLGDGSISALNNDQLYGMGGNDLLVVGIGNHTIDGGNDNDTLRFTENGSPEGPVIIDLNLQGSAQDTGQGSWTITNIENLSGGVANDVLTGDDNVNILAGDNGDDTLNGGGGGDTLLGDGRIATNANNVIKTTLDVVTLGDVGNGNDTLHGGDGNDVLIGGGGNDSLYGEGDADLLRGGLGDDLIDGGSGIDRAGYYQDDPNIGGVTVSLMLQDQAQDTGSQGMDTLHSIENLSGTPFADVLTGDDGSNWIWGSPALLADGSISHTNNDQLYGMGGNDILEVGIGDHTIDGGADTDAIRFTENAFADGPVSINLNQQDGTAQNTGQGNWILLNIENACGGTGNDTITGDGNANVLAGDNGNDTLFGKAGDDTLYGDGRIAIDDHGAVSSFADVRTLGGAGNGNDTLWGGDGSDALYGGGGNDQLFGGDIGPIGSIDQPLDGADILHGGDGNDLLRGASGDDQLFGDDGEDNLRGDLGNDTIDGGAGWDIAWYRFDDAGVASGVTFDASNFKASTTFSMSDGRGGTDTLSNVESLQVTGSAYDDVITGSQYATSDASHFANIIFSLGGNDQIFGGAYADLLNGGNGNDTVIGAGGNDNLTGDAGNDSLDGGAGNDTMSGGTGDDVYWVDSAGDTVTESADEGTDRVETTLSSYTLSANVENLRAYSATSITGNELGNTIDASFADVRVNSVINAGAGDDVILPGWGIDTVNGGSGNDTLVLDYADQTVSVKMAAPNFFDGSISAGKTDSVTFTSVETFRISTGSGNDSIVTSTGNDTISTGAGSDIVNGGGGNDSINGGTGNDTLTGSGGTDTFLVGSASGHDKITDFTTADLISFDASSGVTSYTQLTITQAGKDTIISWGSKGNDITLAGVKAGTVNASEFQFGASASTAAVAVQATAFTSDTSVSGTDHGHFHTHYANDYLFG
jgi:Ca2+-binding RTX toxin-like protein